MLVWERKLNVTHDLTVSPYFKWYYTILVDEPYGCYYDGLFINKAKSNSSPEENIQLKHEVVGTEYFPSQIHIINGDKVALCLL